MSVKKSISASEGLYFITFTCTNWLNLFEIANGYDSVYNWFDYLKEKGHYVCAYVIMPNHVHALIAFRNTPGKSINQIIGNGKRFMAYDLVSRLKAQRENKLLNHLSSLVSETERAKGKLHEIFEPSFDCKECYSDGFIEQKVNYIHENPCRGKWELAKQPWEYVHSSARFYYTGEQGIYPVTSYTDLEDIDLTKAMD